MTRYYFRHWGYKERPELSSPLPSRILDSSEYILMELRDLCLDPVSVGHQVIGFTSLDISCLVCKMIGMEQGDGFDRYL